MNYIKSIIYKSVNYSLLLVLFSNASNAGVSGAGAVENAGMCISLSGIDGSKNYSETVCPGFSICFDIFSGTHDSNKKLKLIYQGNLPGSSFSADQEKHPTGHFCWTPESKDARDLPYEFSVTVVDEEDFSVSSTYHYSISVPLIRVEISSADVTCYGNNDGMATAVVTGGSGNYIYQWQNSDNNTHFITGLGAGEITVHVMDDFGCETAVSKRILSPQPLVLDAIAHHATWDNNSGEAEVMASGGTMPYAYSWLPGEETNEKIGRLPSGVYTAVVTDANGCTAYKQVNVSTELPAVSESERKIMTAGDRMLNNVLIYPNPTRDQFTVKNISDKMIVINVINSVGQDVYRNINLPANLSVSIPVEDQPSGIYLVKVQYQSSIEMARLVKE